MREGSPSGQNRKWKSLTICLIIVAIVLVISLTSPDTLQLLVWAVGIACFVGILVRVRQPSTIIENLSNSE